MANDLAIDNNQDIYVANTDNKRIQKWSVDSWSDITIFPTNDFPFSYPTALFLDQVKYLYIADDFNSRILKWAIDGTEVVRIVVGGNGSYVADTLNHRIMKWVLDYLSGVAVDSENGSGFKSVKEPSSVSVDLYDAGERFMTTATKQSVLKTTFVITLGVVSWRLTL
ncbi:unnamed protein product [Didymodactylos carnosus]|uniref:Uncharacterized protein n=1 Tax=Didymodactylos carnosus TaxID=1234261 RepID=A0A8S2F885_9BILA|nr:unnamed protein product [Didymodactylos carnosus]CAF4191454.1 unnamed protein product [Didymodactylos carnosus]CAF4432551.1 unnamed protein product [Didymodactylos carnosus]